MTLRGVLLVGLLSLAGTQFLDAQAITLYVDYNATFGNWGNPVYGWLTFDGSRISFRSKKAKYSFDRPVSDVAKIKSDSDGITLNLREANGKVGWKYFTVEAQKADRKAQSLTFANAVQAAMVSPGISPSATTPQSASSIQSTIDRITQGTHQELPRPIQTPVSPGQNPGWSIENATAYQLHLYLSGPVERDYVISQGNSIAIDLPPGSYRVAAEVSDKSVIPFYAIRQLNASTRWRSHFYIAPQ